MTKARKNSKMPDANQAPRQSAKTRKIDDPQVMAAVETDAGHIEKIRDIIFGGQMEAYEARFKQLEDRISLQIETLRQETASQLSAMESLVQKQNDALIERLNHEQSERDQGSTALSSAIAKTETSLTKAIDALRAQQAQDIQSMGERLEALSSELSDEIHIQQVEASRSLEQAVQELDDAKLARTALSEMLIQMAGRLSDAQD